MADNIVRRRIEAETVLNRGFAAYAEDTKHFQGEADRSLSSVDQISEIMYVVLRDSEGVLAVYRVASNGELKYEERWPAELA